MKRIIFTLLLLLTLTIPVSADAISSPVWIAAYVLYEYFIPIILVAAVIVVTVILIKKLKKK